MSPYSPDDYDSRGILKIPMLLWAILILQARSVLLLIIAGASRGQGVELLTLFYPERSAFYGGLIAGLPAVGAFLFSGRRLGFPRIWKSFYWWLIVAQLALFIWQGYNVFTTPDGTGLLLGVLDGAALGWLLTNPRLRDVFQTLRVE